MRLRLDDKSRFPPNLQIWLHELTMANRRFECQSAPPASEILSGAPLENGSTMHHDHGPVSLTGLL
jgi:hypothetical protein